MPSTMATTLMPAAKGSTRTPLGPKWTASNPGKKKLKGLSAQTDQETGRKEIWFQMWLLRLQLMDWVEGRRGT